MYNQSILIFFTLCLNFEKIHLAVFYVASTRRRCERQFKSLCTQENVIFKFFIIFKVSTSQFTINQKTKQKSIKRKSFILLKSDFPFMGDIYIYESPNCCFVVSCVIPFSKALLSKLDGFF